MAGYQGGLARSCIRVLEAVGGGGVGGGDVEEPQKLQDDHFENPDQNPLPFATLTVTCLRDPQISDTPSGQLRR